MNRRSFLQLLGLGAAAVTAPTKAYSFLGNILRPTPTFEFEPMPPIFMAGGPIYTLADVARSEHSRRLCERIVEVMGQRDEDLRQMMDSIPFQEVIA